MKRSLPVFMVVLTTFLAALTVYYTHHFVYDHIQDQYQFDCHYLSSNDQVLEKCSLFLSEENRKKCFNFPYESQEQIAAGGTRAVYLSDNGDGEEVLKQLVERSLEHKNVHFKELFILSSLKRHPSLPSVIHSCSYNGFAHSYSIVEKNYGKTIKEAIENGNWSTRDVLQAMIGVASALYILHTSPFADLPDVKVVHNDLHWGQVLVKPGNAVVTDFNMAAILTMQHPIQQLSSWPIMGYAWRFFAPEKLELRAYDTRADIWSFGVLLYQMLVLVNGYEDEWATLTVEKYKEEIMFQPTNGWRPKLAQSTKLGLRDVW
eukprot:CAMPEP_0174272314 /NCGR_PEP_ID=MMETSP0439-20130205/50824_1 /TAXON_ID=0 /ORGANISM="Stereomyxa ramosa, Strain Chinc5" /LENGTH=317 /DNA_ID=CAMNT_0015362799 /DNA_START=47 /DNA_END=997 /DNA_ORIENTATION=-